MKRLFYVILLISNTLLGQNISDALNVSQIKIGGSARFQSISGAFTSLGGDLSATQINPASGSVFLESQASISFGVSNIGNQNTFYNGISSTDNSYSNINQIGIVFISNNNDYSSYITKFSFSANYNRTSNFNSTFSGSEFFDATEQIVTSNGDLYYKGSMSLGAQFTLTANGYSVSELGIDEALAYDTFLIDKNEVGSKYYDSRYPTYTDNFPVYVFAGAPKNKLEVNDIKQDYRKNVIGNNGQYTFAGGISINNNLHIGISYNRASINTEVSTQRIHTNYSNSSDLKEFTYSSYVNTFGSGNGFSIGTIYKINNAIRVGASYESPIWYNLTNNYNYSISTTFKTLSSDKKDSYFSESETKYFDYTTKTPYKLNAGLSFIFAKNGLISIDYQFMDYSKINMGADVDFSQENEEIKHTMTTTNNLKIGTEWKISFIRLRAGYSYSQSPYRDNKLQSDTQSYSIGMGMNFKTWNFDFGYRKYINSQQELMNEVYLNDVANINRTEGNFVATLRLGL